MIDIVKTDKFLCKNHYSRLTEVKLMVNYNSKEKERIMLLEHLFFDPYPGKPLQENPLFFMCRDLGSAYCLGFHENGYTDDYKGFDSKKVRDEVNRLVTDEQLKYYIERMADKKYNSFYGQYYTFDKNTGKFYISSRWEEFEKKLYRYLDEGGTGARAVLEAIYEVNFIHDLNYKNYYPIWTLAKKKGLVKGWRAHLSELQLICIIDTDARHISLHKEMRPLFEKVLGR